MRPRQSVPEAVIGLAGYQAGVFSRAQALGLGTGRKVMPRLLADGRWESLAPGIYLVPGVQPDWMAHVWAGILVVLPSARTWNLTTAALHGLSESRNYRCTS